MQAIKTAHSGVSGADSNPIHAEVVNSIFNRSVLFVAIGSTAGLWWLLRYLDSRRFTCIGMNPEKFLQCWSEVNLNQSPEILTGDQIQF